MILLLTFLTGVSAVAFYKAASHRVDKRQHALARLFQLVDLEQASIDIPANPDWAKEAGALAYLSDRLGKAGYHTRATRKIIAVSLLAAVSLCASMSAVVGLQRFGISGAPIGFIGGAYLGSLLAFMFLRIQTAEFEREVLYRIPLFLEALMLLVESGLGLLPAIDKIVNAKTTDSQDNPVLRFFRFVYDFSAHGMELGKALEIVGNASHIKPLRHVLLHLDVSASEGAGIVSSLRALSTQSHTEWKLSVEGRVRRLENLVVFPVFVSVIGLMLLTAAVPIVPVLELRDTMGSQQNILSTAPLEKPL